MEKVLVVGCFECIGFAVTKKLLEAGFAVFGLPGTSTWSDLKYMEIGRNSQFHLLESIEDEPSFAACVYCLPLLNNSVSTYVKLEVATFVYVSSLQVFAGSQESEITELTEPLDCPQVREEQYVMSEGGVCVRLPCLYGPWQAESDIYPQALKGVKPIQIDAPPGDLLFIDDAATGIFQVFESSLQAELIHLGSGKKNQWKRGLAVINETWAESYPDTTQFFSIKKAEERIGFTPETELEEGINKLRAFLTKMEKLQ